MWDVPGAPEDPTAGVTPHSCPDCHEKLDAAMQIGGGPHRPDPGSWTLCGGCGALLIFDEKLRSVKPTKDQLNTLSPQEHSALKRIGERLKRNG